MDLDSFLVAVYVMMDDWWLARATAVPRGPGRPVPLSMSEVRTRAVVAQWPRWRRERDLWRFAHAQLRAYVPALGSRSQLNRRIRAAEPTLRAVPTALVAPLAPAAEVYQVLDTTLIPAHVRGRAGRHGLCAGPASFGRCASKMEWVSGFKVALSVPPPGVITTCGLAAAACDERPSGAALLAVEPHPASLAAKGYASVPWARQWQQTYGVVVAATPTKTARRAWPDAAGHRQVVER